MNMQLEKLRIWISVLEPKPLLWILKHHVFVFGRYMDPLTNGDYPHSMKSLVGSRLPKFSKQESDFIKGSFDFIGLNYYSANYAAYAPQFRSVNKSYITDSLVNLLSKHIHIFNILHLYIHVLKELNFYLLLFISFTQWNPNWTKGNILINWKFK